MDADEILAAAAKRGKNIGLSSPNKGYTDEESELLGALQRYKSKYQRPNPTVTEVLAVLKTLGWAKQCPKPN